MNCIQFALERAGLPVPEGRELLWCIGPPLHDSFARLAPHFSEGGVRDLVEHYRERYSAKGMFENRVYEGIPELLQAVSAKPLFLATSKPLFFARHIMDHYGLSRHFKRLYGSELDGTRAQKAELIGHILEQEGIPPEDCLIVGDREYDVIGAKATGITSVGITWGYGTREELKKAGADLLIDTPAELLKLLRR